jgi:hypothetical protein
MNYLFTNAPLFVPGMNKQDWGLDIERRVEEVAAKQGSISHAEHADHVAHVETTKQLM